MAEALTILINHEFGLCYETVVIDNTVEAVEAWWQAQEQASMFSYESKALCPGSSAHNTISEDNFRALLADADAVCHCHRWDDSFLHFRDREAVFTKDHDAGARAPFAGRKKWITYLPEEWEGEEGQWQRHSPEAGYDPTIGS